MLDLMLGRGFTLKIKSYFLRKTEKIFMNIVCCGRKWCFKGQQMAALSFEPVFSGNLAITVSKRGTRNKEGLFIRMNSVKEFL